MSTNAAKSKPVELALTPVDNERLANLCGPLDENLRQIELALDVTIARRGERFAVRGESEPSARAIRLLQKFYDESANGLSMDAIQLGLVEYQLAAAEENGAPVLMTRKGDLRGRTPRQRAYLKAILENDISFAIGPAGTG